MHPPFFVIGVHGFGTCASAVRAARKRKNFHRKQRDLLLSRYAGAGRGATPHYPPKLVGGIKGEQYGIPSA